MHVCWLLGQPPKQCLQNVYLKIKGIKISRDITWLNKFYGEYAGLEKTSKVETEADNSSSSEEGTTEQEEEQGGDYNYYQPIANSENLIMNMKKNLTVTK